VKVFRYKNGQPRTNHDWQRSRGPVRKKLHNGFDFVRTETVPLTRMNRDPDYTEWVNGALLLVKNFSSVGRIITAERNDGGL